MATKVKLIADSIITTDQIDTSSLDAHFTGGTGVTYSSGTISIGQAVHSTDSPTFVDLTLTGNLNITGDINSYNVTDLDVTDQTITLGAGQIEANSGGSGIIVAGSNASILWDETNTSWDFNNPIESSRVNTNTVNNVGNTANIIYRSSTNTIVGNNASALVVQDGGNVGIGTTSPASPLTINGTDPLITFENGESPHWQLGFENTQSDRFVLYDNNASAYRMVVNSSGDVGIGTDSPANYTGYTTLTLDNSTSGGDITFRTNGTRVAEIFNDSANLYYDLRGGDHIFRDLTVQKFRIASNGNVSLGTNVTPKATLHIKQEGNNWEDSILLQHNGQNTGWNIHADTNRNSLYLGYNSDTSLVLTSQAATNAFVIASNGDVGINTTNPWGLEVYNKGSKFWCNNTTYYYVFEESNELNVYDSAGTSSTMYLNHNGGDVDLRSGSMTVRNNGDVVIGNTTISPASGFSAQRGFGYDASTGFAEIAATSVGAVLELGTNNASGSAILSLRKESTVVGGISTFDGEAHFGRSTAGIMPIGSATIPRVVPTNFSAGTLADGTVNLGYNNARWKDFFMAGDMNVGSQTTNIVPANRKAWFQGGGSYFTSYSAGESSINADAAALILGTPSTRPGTANQYTAGISFDHLLNYSTTGNVTYNTYPHAWIGLKLYDFPGYERSSLVLATRNNTSGGGPTEEQLVISPFGEVTMPNQPSARFYCMSSPNVSSPTVINSTNTSAAEDFDRNGDYDASTGEFSCPVSGVYFCYVYSNFNSSSAVGYFLLQQYNGSSWNDKAISYKSDTDSWHCVNLVTTIEVSAGTKLRFQYQGDPDAGAIWFYGGWHLLA